MKLTATVFAVVASLGFGSLALAQDDERRSYNNQQPRTQQNAPQQVDQRSPQRHDNRVEQRVDRRMDQRAGHWAQDRVDRRREDRWQDRRVDQRSDPRFDPRVDPRFNQRHDPRPAQQYGQHLDQRNQLWNNRRAYYNARGPEFRRGGYIPREYRNPTYYITDYRPYRLSPPPRNHQWVQVGADYVLIALATGIIANIVLNQ